MYGLDEKGRFYIKDPKRCNRRENKTEQCLDRFMVQKKTKCGVLENEHVENKMVMYIFADRVTIRLFTIIG